MAVIAWCMVDDRGTASIEEHGAIGVHRVAGSWRCRRRCSSTRTATEPSAASARCSPTRAACTRSRSTSRRFAVTILLTRPFLGRYGDRIGYRRIFLPSLVVMTFGMIALTFSDSRLGLAFSAAIFALGFGTAYPAFAAYVMQGVGHERRGAAFGAILAAFDTGIGAGIDDERMADRAVRLSDRVRPGGGALRPRASRLPPQRAPVRAPRRHDHPAAARGTWPRTCSARRRLGARCSHSCWSSPNQPGSRLLRRISSRRSPIAGACGDRMAGRAAADHRLRRRRGHGAVARAAGRGEPCALGRRVWLLPPSMITALTPIWPHPLPPGVQRACDCAAVRVVRRWFAWTLRTTVRSRSDRV